MDITPLSDGELHIPATELLSQDLPAEFTDDEGLMPVNFGGFLVRTPEHTIVVDTGIGGGAIPELPIGTLPERLRAAGVEPEDVDTVIFTHLHFDHVGWATDGERPFFANATHHAHATDWAYWVGPDPHPETGPGREDFGAIPAPERLAPLADSIVLHEGERSEIVPGVTLRLAPGHTPGHCIVEVADGRRARRDPRRRRPQPRPAPRRRLHLRRRRRPGARPRDPRGPRRRADRQRHPDHDDPPRRQPPRPPGQRRRGRRWEAVSARASFAVAPRRATRRNNRST